jgi:DNA-binding NarL/FixJ family response regulator
MNTGCNLYNDCLTCTFEQCYLDNKTIAIDEKHKAIVALSREGLTSDLIAFRVGVSQRTVQRVLKEEMCRL